MGAIDYLRGMKVTEWIGVAGFCIAFWNLLISRASARRGAEKHEWEKDQRKRQQETEKRSEDWANAAGRYCLALRERLKRDSWTLITDERDQAFVEAGLNQGFDFQIDRKENGLLVTLRK